MTRLKSVIATAMLISVLPFSTSGTSFAAGWGPGACTRPGNHAVGLEGPAMNSGQLMAGVGQCRRIGSWRYARRYWGYGAPGWGAMGFARQY
jgi:hypothetical protein